MATLSVTSAMKVDTAVEGNSASMARLVARRVRSVRPRSPILDAPDAAKSRAMCAPRPEPPPVMTMVLPLVESSGRAGEMAGWASVCQVLVKEGKGADILWWWKRWMRMV
jgi:hypothetical protein